MSALLTPTRASDVVEQRLSQAASVLHSVNPMHYVGPLIQRTFERPLEEADYAQNTLVPGAIPLEPSFSEREPGALRFVLEPLGPGHSPAARRDEATREQRRLVGTVFGSDALHWFDKVSEEHRGQAGNAHLDYGAWFGSSYDNDGLRSSKVYYELGPSWERTLPPNLLRLSRAVTDRLSGVDPAFTTIGCGRHAGTHRVTFLPTTPLRIKDLEPAMAALGLGHQLAGLMHIVGLTLGGRFDLPVGSCLLGVGEAPDGAELKLEVALGMIPDLPANFLDLVIMGLTERPRHLQALAQWMRAFTPDDAEWPGNFSVMSVRTTPRSAPRLSFYLRPVELELAHRAADTD